MNFNELCEKVKDGAIPVIVAGVLRRVSGIPNETHINVMICHGKVIHFVEEGKTEILTENFPMMVITRQSFSGEVVIRGYLYKGTTDLILGGAVETDSNISDYQAQVIKPSDNVIEMLNKQYPVEVNMDTAYYGKLIESALKQDYTTLTDCLDDIVWDGVETLEVALDVAQASKESFRKYLSSYMDSLKRHNHPKNEHLKYFRNFAEYIKDKKFDENKIVNIIEKVSPITAKTLNPVIPRIRLSKLLVKTYGTEVFYKVCNPDTLSEAIRKFSFDCSKDIRIDDNMVNTINNVSKFKQYDEFLYTYDREEDTWQDVLCRGFHALRNCDFISIAIMSMFLEDVNSTDLISLYETKQNKLMNEEIEILTVLEQNPYVLKFFNDSIRVEVLDMFALANGLLSRIKGIKSTIILNMRKSIACLEYFDSLSNTEGSTIIEVDNQFFEKNSNTVSKSIFDVTITRKRAYTLLCDSENFTLANWDKPINGSYGKEFKSVLQDYVITDSIKNVERHPLMNIYGTLYNPSQVTWNYRGIYQFAGRTSARVSLIATQETERLNILNITGKTGHIIGIKISDKIYFGTTNDIKNEYNIFRSLNVLKNRTLSVDMDKIEKLIVEFEDMKGFKLEEKQKDAVRAVSNNIVAITGPAGSGKTTTAEAMLYAIENIFGGKTVFAAPTGKAANRLREIVNRPVSTIHSLFKIGSDSNEEKEVKKIDADTLVIDEYSMVHSALMSKVMDGIDLSKTKLVLIGDIEQLPPIGAGKPFADIINKKYFPIIQLDVVKRCADGSAVTLNASIMIGKPPKGVTRTKVETDEEKQKFIVLDMKPSHLVADRYDKEQSIIIDIVKHHLGMKCSYVRVEDDKAYIGNNIINNQQFNADDIIVVTPLKKASHKLGSIQLNTLLQPIINPENTGSKMQVIAGGEVQQTIFRVGDRVLHTKNIYTKARYIMVDGKITEYPEYAGIMNGEVGKIAFIRPLDDLREMYVYNNNMNDEIASRIEPDFDRSDDLAIGVVYSDMDSEGNPYSFYILYLANVQGKDKIDTYYNANVVGETGLLDLAYAMTVHKMQGSQGKLVICPIYDMYQGMLNRNMPYTAVTRTRDVTYLIGDIKSDLAYTSVFDKMLKIQATEKRHTILGVLMESK